MRLRLSLLGREVDGTNDAVAPLNGNRQRSNADPFPPFGLQILVFHIGGNTAFHRFDGGAGLRIQVFIDVQKVFAYQFIGLFSGAKFVIEFCGKQDLPL